MQSLASQSGLHCALQGGVLVMNGPMRWRHRASAAGLPCCCRWARHAAPSSGRLLAAATSAHGLGAGRRLLLVLNTVARMPERRQFALSHLELLVHARHFAIDFLSGCEGGGSGCHRVDGGGRRQAVELLVHRRGGHGGALHGVQRRRLQRLKEAQALRLFWSRAEAVFRAQSSRRDSGCRCWRGLHAVRRWLSSCHAILSMRLRRRGAEGRLLLMLLGGLPCRRACRNSVRTALEDHVAELRDFLPQQLVL